MAEEMWEFREQPLASGARTCGRPGIQVPAVAGGGGIQGRGQSGARIVHAFHTSSTGGRVEDRAG